MYAVTNFWSPEIFLQNPELEQIQGRLLADVAEEQGVEVYIWSSLHDVEAITKGRFPIPAYTGKNKVEQYLNRQIVLEIQWQHCSCRCHRQLQCCH